MSEYKKAENASLSAKATLSGKLSCNGGLTGTLSVGGGYDYETYDGEYEVVPRAFHSQTLKTADKLLTKDIVVAEVFFFETDNEANGKTVYIAKEV